MMKGLFGLLLVIVAFIAWMGSVTKVIQWNQAQQRGDRRVEEPSSPPGEAPSLLGRRTIGGGERSGAALLEFAIDPLSITTDESVEAELSLHSEGRFEVRMPKRWDLEQSKEFVYRI